MTATEQMNARNAALADIHQTLLPAFIEAAENGHSAKMIFEWLGQAREGMVVNAAFCVNGNDLADALRLELKNP